MQKASLVKGTRDFGPIELARRNYIFDIIRTVFKSYGFAGIETPSMETLDTLMGKYGDEGDTLLFKILNNGDILEQAKNNLNSNNGLKNAISDKGLRYDLTVPFARYTAMNRHDIKMPFKRYQMQAVWRADRPQKGRYREFWQCDADTIGTSSLLCEMESIEILDKVFQLLGIDVIIHINHRKLLEGFSQSLGMHENFIDFTVAIDKLDKIGIEGVCNELAAKKIDIQAFKNHEKLLSPIPFNSNSLKTIEIQLANNDLALQGLSELLSVYKLLGKLHNQVLLDMSLARGLSYYTGAIFEVKLVDKTLGSVAAGGRYDNLTEVFGVKDISGIGFSFGADRIYDVLVQKNQFPATLNPFADVLICPMEENTIAFAAEMARTLRSNTQQSVMVFPQAQKLGKQLDYANALNMKYAIIIGSNEIESQIFAIKNLLEGKQEHLDMPSLINLLK